MIKSLALLEIVGKQFGRRQDFFILFRELDSITTFIITGLMVNRMFAVQQPIERNHYITLAISFFNDKAFKLHCKDYDK